MAREPKQYDITITISGPQGVGKTVLAGAINELLARSGAKVWSAEDLVPISPSRLTDILGTPRREKKVLIRTTNLRVAIVDAGKVVG